MKTLKQIIEVAGVILSLLLLVVVFPVAFFLRSLVVAWFVSSDFLDGHWPDNK